MAGLLLPLAKSYFLYKKKYGGNEFVVIFTWKALGKGWAKQPNHLRKQLGIHRSHIYSIELWIKQVKLSELLKNLISFYVLMIVFGEFFYTFTGAGLVFLPKNGKNV